MTLTLVATADLHLGMTFSSYAEVGAVLAEARFDALDRIIDAANDASADIIVVAGDLFDRPRLAAEIVHRAVSSFRRFEGALVAILPGNHDYTGGPDAPPWDAFMRAAVESRLDVLMLDEQRPYDLREHRLPCVLLPGPCTSKHRESNAIGWIAELADTWSPSSEGAETGRAGDAIVVGVAHGSIEGISPDMERRYYPMRPADFERSPADFWIVGHTHLHRESSIGGNRRLFIPGAPEPDGFDFDDAGDACLVTVDEGRRIESRTIPIGRFRFYDRSAEVHCLEEIEEAARIAPNRDPQTTLMRVALSGGISSEEYRLYTAWRRRQAVEFLYFQVDDRLLHEEISRERIDALYPVDSFPHRLLSELLEEDDVEAVETAYRYLDAARRGGGENKE